MCADTNAPGTLRISIQSSTIALSAVSITASGPSAASSSITAGGAKEATANADGITTGSLRNYFGARGFTAFRLSMLQRLYGYFYRRLALHLLCCCAT
jgi:hypothetical protein